MLHTRRIWLFTARPDALNLLRIVKSTLTKIHSKTWTRFPNSNTLKTSQTLRLNHRHLCRRRKYTPSLALSWSIEFLSHGNVTLRAALRPAYKTIPTTRSRRVKSPNISSMGSRRRAWRRNMTSCWMKKTPLCVSAASTTGMASRSSWRACQMIRLSGSGKYTLSRIWHGMTIANALSNTGVETSSNAWDGWCGSKPTPSISFSPLSVVSTAIRPPNAYIPKCTLRTCGGRHR